MKDEPSTFTLSPSRSVLLLGLVALLGCSGPSAVRDPAPASEISLPDQQGRPTRLSDYRGKWVVLYFYPEDDTPGCTLQARDFTAMFEDFSRLNAAIIGVSGDGTSSHRFFTARHALRITLLSDPDRRLTTVFGAWKVAEHGGRRAGRVLRTTVLIDPDGHEAHRWSYVVPEGHAQEVRRTLESLASSR